MTLHPEEQKKARRKAMQLLEHMDRTEKSLSDRLGQAGFSKEAVEDAIHYVKSYGYVDDLRYARNYISYRVEIKSRQKLLAELSVKGVSRETAVKAWDEVAELYEPDEQEVLRRTVEKKYSVHTELDEKEMRRLKGYLLRRGFSYEDIRHVLEEMDIVQINGKF